MTQIVEITFSTQLAADTVESWITAVGSCGVVRPAEAKPRSYLVTVRRAGAMEYLQTLLREGEKRGVLAWQLGAGA